MSTTNEEPVSPPTKVVRIRRYIGILLLSAIAAVACVGLIIAFENRTVARPPAAGTGFELRSAIVDPREIQFGGVFKDQIPALTNPEVQSPADPDYLKPTDRVIGVAVNDEVRAYPLAILNHHEVVNDQLGSTPIAVTYCPLCDSAAVFDRRTPLGDREFGVSGLLYNSNVLLYDRRGTPESLWSQVGASGISGPGVRKQLTTMPCELTTWASWKTRFPMTKVLSMSTGYRRDYYHNPYEEYFKNQDLMFPAAPRSDLFPNKERVLGVWVNSAYRAYAESAFPNDETTITDTLAGKSLTVELDRTTRTLRVVRADDGVSWLYSFWFAWYALHPDTTVFGRK